MTKYYYTNFSSAGQSVPSATLQVCPRAQNTDDSLEVPDIQPGPSEPRKGTSFFI